MGAVLSKVVNEEWMHMPWKAWTSPKDILAVKPSFAIIEWTYRLIAMMCLRHALNTKGNTLPIFFSSFICGTFNDIFFMFLPLCDNFWQAQASIMITPRLPLYIVEMYSVIVYLSTVAARQFNLPYVAEATLTGLLAHLTYHVYDINGPPNLWWTWHDSDPAISKRHYNAPIGSSMWILTYIGLHSMLLRFVESPYAVLPYIHEAKLMINNFLLARTNFSLLNNAKVSAVKFLNDVEKINTSNGSKINLSHKVFLLLKALSGKALAALLALQMVLNKVVNAFDLRRTPSSLLEKIWCKRGKTLGWGSRIVFSGLTCTPLFMIGMGIFQMLSFDQIGVPGQPTYRMTLLIYSLITALGFRTAWRSGALFLPKQKSSIEANKRLLKFVFLFYAVNIAIGKYSVAENHLSTGVHQKFSSFSKKVKDIMFYVREDHILKTGPVEHSRNDYQLVNQTEDLLNSHRSNVGDALKEARDRAGKKIVVPESEGTFSEWYTVVGKKRLNKDSDNRRLQTFALMGSVVYSLAFLNVFSLPAYID